MSAGLARLSVPIVAVLVLGAAVAWFGVTRMMPGSPAPGEPAGAGAVVPSPPGQGGSAGGAPSSTPQSAAGPRDQAPPSEKGRSETAGRDRRPAEPATPSFDVVRVEPSGESVIAGRAAPGATVDLLSNGQSLARIMADPSGLFAFVPPPLTPGSHEIVVQTIAPDGSRARSNQSVTVVISEKRDTRPLVAVTTPGQPTVVLSRPEGGAGETKEAAIPRSGALQAGPTAERGSAPTDKGAPGARPELRILSVEAEGTGRLYVSGSAAPGATLRLYLNDSFVAPGGTDPDGRLSFVIERGIRAGEYRVRLDDVDPVSGSVRSRAEVPFNVPAPMIASASPDAEHGPIPVPPARPSPPRTARASTAFPPGGAEASASDASQASTGFASRETDPGAVVVPEVNTAIVSRGDNLWRISKRSYGNGLRYTVIYGANQAQIRSPGLIYPGQIFVIPSERAQAAR
jgi:nucleoid-associated protein YgaU